MSNFKIVIPSALKVMVWSARKGPPYFNTVIADSLSVGDILSPISLKLKMKSGLSTFSLHPEKALIVAINAMEEQTLFIDGDHNLIPNLHYFSGNHGSTESVLLSDLYTEAFDVRNPMQEYKPVSLRRSLTASVWK